jgi:hypothetical protein
MKHDAITVMAGTWPVKSHILSPFAPIVCSFLDALAEGIRQDPLLKSDTASSALAFWLRRRHLEYFQSLVSAAGSRLGRGTIFHIAPANIPILFAYSLIISMLAGNSNVVRISERAAQSVRPLCALIDHLWQQPRFQCIGQGNALIAYDRSRQITDSLSAACHGRIIWGGDESIAVIRQSPLAARAVELAFADRYSLALFQPSVMAHWQKDEWELYAHRFYLDTYDMDQNACSSPKLVIWLPHTGQDLTPLQQHWWDAVAGAAIDYDLAPIKVSRKYTQLWQFAVTVPEIKSIQRQGNDLYVYTLSSLPDDITRLAGTFGQFFQYEAQHWEQVISILTRKIQTVSVIGVPAKQLRQAIIANGAAGCDRIVPTGQAMEMHIIWDGINMIEYLSRVIS